MAPESTTWASIDRKLNIDFEYGQNFEVWGRIYREIVSYVGYDEMADFGEKTQYFAHPSDFGDVLNGRILAQIWKMLLPLDLPFNVDFKNAQDFPNWAPIWRDMVQYSK